MKKIFSYKNCLFLLLINVAYIPADCAQIISKKLTAVVDVILEDTTLLHGSSVEFDINQNNINTDFAGFTSAYTKRLSGKKTRFEIPLSTPVNYGRIQLDNDGIPDYLKSSLPLNDDNNLFIFQAGDTVELHLLNKKQGALFKGKSADKYNCTYQMGNINEVNSYSKSNALFKAKDYTSAFTCKKKQRDSIYKLQLGIINEFRGKLPGGIEKLIKLDCWGLYHKSVVDIYFNSPFMSGKKELYQPAKNLFIRDYGNYREAFPDTMLLTTSFKYGQFLTVKEKAFAVISKSTTDKNFYDDLAFGDIYNAINLHYKKGALKDEITLLSFLNLDRRKQGDFTNYIQESIDHASANQFKDALKRFKSANTSGAKAFSFELPDKDGHLKKLTDFKGKLIVIDFWFTGCRGCTEMAKVLQPVISKYRSNPNIVFISVSIDKSESIWKTSLAQGRYTGEDETNLLAKSGMQSAIIKHYNISTFPALLIISKDGNTISNAPPDPRFNLESFMKLLDLQLN